LTENKNLPIKEEIKNQIVNIFGTDLFPEKVQSGINEIMELVNNNTTVPELYEKELKETMVSTSIFQDICVQMEEHHTPHRKVRQVMLELSDKLDALDAVKNNHRKKIIKLQTIEDQINELQEIYDILNQDKAVINFNLALRLSNISYQTKQGMDSFQTNNIISSNIIQITSNGIIINEPKFIQSIRNKVKIALGNLIVDHEENKRGIKNSQHMIKDSAVKAHQLRLQADKYSKEMAASDLSFDESEFIYYTMFFTAEAERQLRTGDHQVDRGTYKAISQLPEFIRLKVLWNIDYIKNKLISNNMNISMDYIFKTDEKILWPKFERDVDGILIVEGYKVDDYLLMEPIRVLTSIKEK